MIITQINAIIESKKIGSIKLSYNEFSVIINNIKESLGYSGLVMISEKTAAISLEKNSNVRFIVTSNKEFSQKDFKCFDGIEFKIIGKERDKQEKYRKRIIDDILDNKFKIFIFLIIYALFYSIKISYDSLDKLNNSLVNVINIFIASFFVFIGFFYSDKIKNINLFKKGLFDKYLRIDLYILSLSFTSLVLCMISSTLINTSGISAFMNTILHLPIKLSKYSFLKYYISLILTFISILCITICFDSIYNYYIKKIRTNYFIDAYSELIEEEKNKEIEIKKGKVKVTRRRRIRH